VNSFTRPSFAGPYIPNLGSLETSNGHINARSEEDMEIFPGNQFNFSTNGKHARDIKNFPVGFTVRTATAVIESMDVQFANHNDHHLGRLQVDLFTDVTGGQTNVVQVTVQVALRDWSGGDNDVDGDDPIKGFVRYSVFVQ
jgi:hypothetical protein